MTQTVVLFQGNLLKRKSEKSGVRGIVPTTLWNKRWFTVEAIKNRKFNPSLKQDIEETTLALCYYNSASSREPKGWVSLDNIVSVKPTIMNRHEFVIKTTRKTFYLKAKYSTDFNMWVAGLKSLCGLPMSPQFKWPAYLGPVPTRPDPTRPET